MAWTTFANAVALTLSNGGLTALSTGTSASAQSPDVFLVGSNNKFYFEITLQTAPDTNSFYGVANGGYVYANLTYAGCLVTPSGALYYNGAVAPGSPTIGALVNGNVLCVAVDLLNKAIWFRNGAGNWNGNVANNPATNVGGVAIPLLNFVAPFARMNVGAIQVTANFGATAFAQTVPSGFTAGWLSPGIQTAELVSQAGMEAWFGRSSTPTALNLSQAGLEAWFSNNSGAATALNVSQIGFEAFFSTNTNIPSAILFTQMGVEVFLSTGIKVDQTQPRVMVLA